MQHERRLRQSLEHPKLFYADSGSCSMQRLKKQYFQPAKIHTGRISLGLKVPGKSARGIETSSCRR
jgi:hypothetical protein